MLGKSVDISELLTADIEEINLVAHETVMIGGI